MDGAVGLSVLGRESVRLSLRCCGEELGWQELLESSAGGEYKAMNSSWSRWEEEKKQQKKLMGERCQPSTSALARRRIVREASELKKAR